MTNKTEAQETIEQGKYTLLSASIMVNQDLLIKLLESEVKRLSTFAHIHGITTPQETIEKASTLRNKIKKLIDEL